MKITCWRRWTLILMALAGAWRGAALAHGADRSAPDWVFQHGAEPLPGVTWDKLGAAYLGRFDWEDVGADAAPAAASRLVIAEASSPLVVGLLAELGLAAEAPLEIDGAPVGPGTGLVICAPDPDGAGRVALFTGEDPAGVFQTLTTSVDLGSDEWHCVRGRTIVRRGTWPIEAAPVFKTERPLVLRLDRRFFETLDRMGGVGPDEALLVAARALVGEGAFFEAALGPNVDLFRFYRRALTTQADALAAARETFGAEDLASLVQSTYAKALDALGTAPGPAPAVAFLIGDPVGTNARTFDPDPMTGRPRVLVNVAAHADLAVLEISIAHELVHTFQRGGDGSLVSQAMKEGVASFASGELSGERDEARLLMWSDEKLAAAEARRAELLAAFTKARVQSRAATGDWLLLGRPLAAVPGAPDRCAYWLGFQAAKAWRKANPKAPLGELLALAPDDFFAALE